MSIWPFLLNGRMTGKQEFMVHFYLGAENSEPFISSCYNSVLRMDKQIKDTTLKGNSVCWL